MSKGRPVSEARLAVLAAVSSAPHALAPSQIADRIGRDDYGAVRQLVNSMYRDKQLVRGEDGKYSVAPGWSGNFLTNVNFSAPDEAIDGASSVTDNAPAKDVAINDAPVSDGITDGVSAEITQNTAVTAESHANTPHPEHTDMGMYHHGDGSNPRSIWAVYDEYGRLVPCHVCLADPNAGVKHESHKCS